MFVQTFGGADFLQSVKSGRSRLQTCTSRWHLRMLRRGRLTFAIQLQEQQPGRGTDAVESEAKVAWGEVGAGEDADNGASQATDVDMPMPSRPRRTGATVDADGKSNVWAIEPRVYTESSVESVTKKYLALAIAGFVGLAIIVLRFLPLTNADQM
jgi:hypothetical protein